MLMGGGDFDVFEALQLDCQNLTRQVVGKQYKCMVKDSVNPSKYFP